METKIEKLDAFGRGIIYENNKIGFIEGSYPEDIITYQINNEKSKYFEGKIKEIIKKSKYRINSKCPYSNQCGGCIFQEYDYEEENKWKETKIKELVEKVLKQNTSIVKNTRFKEEKYYRNKMILHGKNKELGEYEKNSHNIINLENCIICNQKINNIIPIIKEYKNIEECLIRTSNNEKEILVNIKGKDKSYDKLLDYVDVLIINNKYKTKNHSIKTNIGNKNYQLSSDSFFQINKGLTKDLYDKVLEEVKKIKPDTALDLYCGTGSIGIYVAEECKKIIGIDYNPSNIKDAKENVELNQIHNIEFICDKVENKINDYKNIDLIIVDPPRAGLDNKTRDTLNKIKSKHIIYVSCDPQTLIRDLKELNNEYIIKEITPFNMFPRTYHVESISVLERKNVEK